MTRYRSGCYEILAPNKWHWTSDISACGKTCSDLRLLGDNELRMQTLPAQPRSSQAAMTVKQEFKQTLTHTHTHTHMWSLTASMTGVYKLNDMNIEQVTCYMAATSWPLNLEVVEFQQRLASNLKRKDSYSIMRLTSKVKIECEQVTCYSVWFHPGDFEQATRYFGALVWTAAYGVTSIMI